MTILKICVYLTGPLKYLGNTCLINLLIKTKPTFIYLCIRKRQILCSWWQNMWLKSCTTEDNRPKTLSLNIPCWKHKRYYNRIGYHGESPGTPFTMNQWLNWSNKNKNRKGKIPGDSTLYNTNYNLHNHAKKSEQKVI